MNKYLKPTISIHVPREGDDIGDFDSDSGHVISIHVPREGDDCTFTRAEIGEVTISIHVPREGDDMSHVMC